MLRQWTVEDFILFMLSIVIGWSLLLLMFDDDE